MEDLDLLLDLGGRLRALEQDLDALGPRVLLPVDRFEPFRRDLEAEEEATRIVTT
ncbi:MAG: hypothetical protein ABI467_25245 [Kofleriaceae bacterium]